MTLLLTAQFGKEAQFVGSRVVVIEIHVYALAKAGAALSQILADEPSDGRASGTGAKAMYKPHAKPSAVRFRGRKALVILELAGKIGRGNVSQQRRCLGRDTRLPG